MILLLLSLLQDPATLGDQAYRDGRYAEAADHYEKAISALKEKDRPAALWLALGHASLQAKRWDAAIRAFQTVIALKAAGADVQRGLGQAQVFSGRSEEAIGSFRRAAALDPEGADFLTIARIRAQREEWLLAEHEVSAQLRIDPGSIDSLELLAYVLTRQNKHAEAAAVYRMLSRRKPGEFKYLIACGQAEAAQKRYGEAVDLLELAWRLGSVDPDALRLLADLYLQVQMPREAAAAYTRLLGLLPNPSAEDWHRLGYARWTAGEPAAARTAFERAGPAHAPSLLQLARLGVQDGDAEAGRRACAAALKAAPGNPEPAELLGTLEFRAGRFAAAAEAFAEAIRRGDTRTAVLASQVRALQQAGQAAAARDAVRSALHRHPLDEPLRALARSLFE